MTLAPTSKIPTPRTAAMLRCSPAVQSRKISGLLGRAELYRGRSSAHLEVMSND